MLHITVFWIWLHICLNQCVVYLNLFLPLMNILSFQFEDFFQHFSWGGTSGDELHQVCFVWDSFYFSFISERQLFWKEYSWMAGFSILALWVCPWMKAKLLLVAGEPGRHLSFRHDAAVAASCGWFKSEPSSPAKYFLDFFFHGICASCHLKYYLS